MVSEVTVTPRLTREEEKNTVRHIDDFTVHRFRGLRDLKLTGLGQVNLLVGDNNSGKTSILESLFLFSNSLSQRRWLDTASMREVSSNPLRSNLSDQLAWLFPQSKGNQGPNDSEISLSATGNFPLDHISARYEKVSEINRKDKYVVSSAEENEIDNGEEYFLRESEGIRIFINAPMINRQLSLFEEENEYPVALH